MIEQSEKVRLLQLCNRVYKEEIRRVGLPIEITRFRYRADTEEEALQLIYNTLNASNPELRDAFCPFYSNEERETRIVSRLFIDLDIDPIQKETIESIWSNLNLFLYLFNENTELYFSGNKGFSIYIHIKPTSFDELFEERERLYFVLSAWLQKFLDKKVFLELKRIHRIPLTKHRTSGLWKVPVTPDLTVEKILSIAKAPEKYIDYLVSAFNKQVLPLPDWKILLKNPADIL
jgi:DNA primase catalytic subunit